MLGSIKKMLLGEDTSKSLGTKCSPVETSIKVNPLTDKPDRAWDLIKNKVTKNEVEPLNLDTPIFDNKIRFVCISDTHSKADKMKTDVPPGDILLHAGDFTNRGSTEDITKFSNFLESLNDKFKYKVVIVGNHELSFDQNCINRLKPKDGEDPRDHLKHCIYLEDSYVELFGLKIYGSPWQPEFCQWAYNLERGQDLLEKWNMIPDDTDVLITHGPPLGFGDRVRDGYHVGCCELQSTIMERVKPKFHIFGHIHEDYGIWTDETTTYINASICTLRYAPNNPPIIFDIELPPGVSKSDFAL